LAAGRPRAAMLASLAVCLLVGCGDGAKDSGEPAEVGAVRAGSAAPLAQCRDWVEGNRAQRVATIQDIREQLNQTGSGEPTSDLDDEEAYAVLQRACRQDFAAGFRLYKLYARAAAFAPLAGR
jgi:hypothetical protein